jgi:hypothetical protein
MEAQITGHKHTLSKVGLEPLGHVAKVPHPPSASSLPPNGLHAPVVCFQTENESIRIPTHNRGIMQLYKKWCEPFLIPTYIFIAL